MRFSRVARTSYSQCRMVATVLGSIPASSDTVESEGRQMKQCWISYIKKGKPKKSPFIYSGKIMLNVAETIFVNILSIKISSWHHYKCKVTDDRISFHLACFEAMSPTWSSITGGGRGHKWYQSIGFTFLYHSVKFLHFLRDPDHWKGKKQICAA